MKRVLIDFKGGVQAIANPGEEFDVFEGPGATLKWVDCESDDVTPRWLMERGRWVQDWEVLPDPSMTRKFAYGEVGEQLDMIYKDMKNGTTNWVDHIDAIKAMIPSASSPEILGRVERIIDWGTPERPAWIDPDAPV